MTDSEILIADIERAFDDTEPPPSFRVVDEVPGDLEREEIADAFRERHWKTLDTETLRYHAEAVFFFTPEAFRYYLPSYLLAVLKAYEETDVLPDLLIAALTPPPEDDKRLASFLARVEPLTIPQKRALAAFLEFMQQEHGEDFLREEPRRAIEDYWKSFS